MGYEDEKVRILDYVTRNGEIIELTPNKDNVKRYYRELVILNNSKKIAIRFPGYKTKRGKSDYCVYLEDGYEEKPISHVEIMQDLYNKTTIRNYSYMKRYVEDVARYGKDIDIPVCLYDVETEGFTFEELTHLMFYIALQEDINYPMPKYLGRTMCYFRYLEAIFCKVNAQYSLNDAIEKATRRGGPPAQNWRNVGDLYDIVSRIRYED
ncbi:MAG: hypothetical protein NC089_08970 [Bacteroides sp.]|nr:hypothetical protein [Bacteroides sp.]MCM1549922.1 hypothetical protein [Clostridium sp.]